MEYREVKRIRAFAAAADTSCSASGEQVNQMSLKGSAAEQRCIPYFQSELG